MFALWTYIAVVDVVLKGSCDNLFFVSWTRMQSNPSKNAAIQGSLVCVTHGPSCHYAPHWNPAEANASLQPEGAAGKGAHGETEHLWAIIMIHFSTPGTWGLSVHLHRSNRIAKQCGFRSDTVQLNLTLSTNAIWLLEAWWFAYITIKTIDGSLLRSAFSKKIWR